jgi:hypothetical protein
MGYLRDPKTATIFVTASPILRNGRYRKIIVEIRPEFAILKLHGVKARCSLAWETIFEMAVKQDAVNRRLEGRAPEQPRRARSSKKEQDGLAAAALPPKRPVASEIVKRAETRMTGSA